MARGNDRQPIFTDERDRRSLLALIDDTRRHRKWRVHAWCLMTNHVHVLVTTPDPGLSDGLRDVLGLYTRRYNHFHGRTGHLFSARFRAVVVTSDRQFLTAFRYVNRNPVEAGLVSDPAAYPWTGYATRALPRPPIGVDEEVILQLLHPSRAMAERQLHHVVHAPTPPGRACERVPSLTVVLQALGPREGARAARTLGYRQREIATALGISESRLSRQLRAASLRR